jgi:biotin carboxylase
MVLAVREPQRSLALSERNVFFLGLNEFNLRMLRRIRGAEHYRFHGLLEPSEVIEQASWDIDILLDAARAHLDTFDGHVDAIAGYIDFPVSLMVPVLCRELGLRSPTLEAMLKCEHKHWSRMEQRAVIPDHVPASRVFDPTDDGSVAGIDLPYPYWVKPVKSYGSHLGFRVGNGRELQTAIDEIRRRLPRLAVPFGRILEHATLPAPVAALPPHACVAEALIGGRQCTLEGFVSDGCFEIFGVVDSIRAPNRTTFMRYEYPSSLPQVVQQRMEAIARRFLEHVGFENGAFNAEMFWDERRDHIWVLEVNPRISQSHSPLFEAVDGASNQQVTVHVALGEDPTFPFRQGLHRYAAKLFLRTFEDAHVRRVPSEDDLRHLEAEIPGTRVQIIAREGTKLSDQRGRDSYSYEIAYVFVSGDTRAQLAEHRRTAERLLPFTLEPVREGAPALA